MLLKQCFSCFKNFTTCVNVIYYSFMINYLHVQWCLVMKNNVNFLIFIIFYHFYHFLINFNRFWSVLNIFHQFFYIFRSKMCTKTIKNDQKRSKTVKNFKKIIKNSQKWSKMVKSCVNVMKKMDFWSQISLKLRET